MKPADVRRVAEAAKIVRTSSDEPLWLADDADLARAFAIVRREALEEAAQAMDKLAPPGYAGYGAKIIRALAATEKG